jgi:hypothetical protein
MTAAEFISNLHAMDHLTEETRCAYIAEHFYEFRLKSGTLVAESDVCSAKQFFLEASEADKLWRNSGSTEVSGVTEIRPRLRVTGRDRSAPNLNFCTCTRTPSPSWADCPDCGHVHETSAECGKWLQEHSSAPVGRR